MIEVTSRTVQRVAICLVAFIAIVMLFTPTPHVEAGQQAVPRELWVFRVVPLVPADVDSKWSQSLGLSAGSVRTSDTYTRFDHGGVSVFHYANSDDVVVTDQERKYAGTRAVWALGDSDVQAIAEAFLRSNDLLSMSTADALAPVEVRHVREDEIDVEHGTRRSQTNTAIALFERLLDGVPAVGAGSHAAVYVAGDRRVVGADIAWRRLERYRAVPINSSITIARDVVGAMGVDEGRIRAVADGRLGYYFGPRGGRQEYVAPVWVYLASGEDDLRRAARWQAIIPASDASEYYAGTALADGRAAFARVLR